MSEILLNEALKIWGKVNIGEPAKENSFDLEVQKKLLNIFSVGDYYYYIFNLKESKFDLISEEVESVLGYKPEELDLINFISKIHPEDQPWFLNIENKLTEFFSKLSSEQIPNYKIRYDFRLQKSNGEYIRVLQQVITIQHSEEGGLLRTFGVHTDISEIKMEGKPLVSIIGLNGEPSYIDIEIDKIFTIPSNFLSRREQEILLLLVQGKRSKEIALELFISPATVSTHRKNLLYKSKARNTSELISLAIRNGWV